MKKNIQSSVKTALIKLYLSLKEYIKKGDKDKEKENIEYLEAMNEIKLIKYIKEVIDSNILIMAEKKINEYNKRDNNEFVQNDFESMLIKYESDIRGHIKTEHQLKLYSDSLQSNIDELLFEKDNLVDYNKNFKDMLAEKNKEINTLKKEINQLKKKIKILEDDKQKSEENDKKLKNIIMKMEKKHKMEIDNLNKKLLNCIDKIQNECSNNEQSNKDKKSETIYNSSSHYPNNKNIIKNFIENEGNCGHNTNRIYRNLGNNISIGNSHSNSIATSRPYEKIEKYLINKYPKNKGKEQYQNKSKNNKNEEDIPNNEQNIPNINNNNNNNSFIINSKVQDEFINKFLINDSLLTNTIKKSKKNKIYHRHKSIENDNYKYIKCKQMNFIKKILLSNNNSNKNINNNNNSIKNPSKQMNKNIYNNNILNNMNNKGLNSSTGSVNKNYMNKTAKDMNINNIFGNKNNIGCSFVNNINIYSNNLKQDNGNNIILAHNIKNYAENATIRELINNNNINNSNNGNYIHIHGNKNQFINYRNKQKDVKMTSSLNNNAHKNF